MYERLLNKEVVPTEDDIAEYLGEKSFKRLCNMEKILKEQYELQRELKFPFGNSYGWGYKYSHRSTHLCYVFFEKDAFTVMIQIGDGKVKELESMLPLLLPKARELWKNRYPCGKSGGWIHYRVLNNEELNDVIKLINVRKMPK